MATIRLVPSTYYFSNSSYLSASNESNMYTNTDSTTYGTVTNSASSTSSYYIYLRGFNFDDVPSNAVVSNISIKIKAYHSGGNTSTIYGYNGTTQVSSCGSTTALGTSATVKTFTNTTIGWDTLKNYGSNFGIRINCRRSNKNTTSYIYIYGAEIEVTYTVPVYHDVSVTNNTNGTVSPSGTTSVLEGNSYTVRISGLSAKPTVTDNGTDVTSSVTGTTSVTEVLVPNGNTVSTFTATNITNAYEDKDSTTYAQLALSGSSTGTVYLDFEDLNIPSGATINSVTCQVTLQFNANGSTSRFTSSCQMYAGSTAKGSSTQWVSSSSNVAKTTYTLTIGSWTASEINNARFYLTATNSARSTSRSIYIYGISFSVSYESDGIIYVYTISSVSGNHTIVVSQSAQNKMYVKVNGSWVEATAVYKKVNGSWVQQTDLSNVFENGVNYLKS